MTRLLPGALVALLAPVLACSDGSISPRLDAAVRDGGGMTDGGQTSGPDASVEGDAGEDGGVLAPWNEGQWTVGKARFTVITDTLIRVEYDAEAQFVDATSYFAVEREARFHHALFTQQGQTATLETGKLTLRYTDDGQPLSETNLRGSLVRDGEVIEFSPTSQSADNLGGTTRTLDRWTGSGLLDDGMLSRAGWYRLDDSEGHLLEDGWVRARDRPTQDFYVFGYGHDYRAALRSLTAVGGSVPMPRKAVLGAWYSRYWPYTSVEFEAIADEYDAHDYPLDVMVLDMDWHLEGWTGWTWNRELIADPAALLDDLHERGLRVTLNVHPADGVAMHEASYGDFMSALGKDPASGETVPYDAADRAYMEALFSQVHAPLTRDGNDFFWLDWQQAEFTRSLPKLGHVPWLNELYYRYEQRDGLRGTSFSRWGGFGDHRHPIHFSGDASTSFEMLAFEVPFTATSSNSGLFFWTHDIGGHQGARIDEAYARWCQFGAFSAAMRSHSTRSENLDRRPWTYESWAEASMKRSFQLRSILFPYLYSAVWRASHESDPLIRSMYVDHPEEPAAYLQPQQYVFGPALLVAPVTEPGAGAARLGRQAVWFPQGTYYDFFRGERFLGPGEHLVASTIDELPVFARAGVPIPMQPFTRRMATEQTRELVVRCYRGEDGERGTFTLYEDDGETEAYRDGAFATTLLSCSREGDEVTFEVAGTEGSFTGQLETRAYVIELPASERADRVRVDGQDASVDYDAVTFVNRVHVPARAIGQKTTVSLRARALSDDTLRRAAFAARTGADASLSLEQMVTSSVSRASTAREKVAILAAAGVGAFEKNEHLYGHPNAPHFVIYEQPWAPATISVRDDVRGGVQAVSVATIALNGTSIERTIAGDIDFARPGENLAPSARATFSSTENAETVGIADGKVGGYPERRSEEWSTARETTGAQVTLTWDSARRVARVVLFDRINEADQITGGTLRFSDGSSVRVGAIPNTPAEGPLAVDFAARDVTWLSFTVDSVTGTTENVGLSELAVYGP